MSIQGSTNRLCLCEVTVVTGLFRCLLYWWRLGAGLMLSYLWDTLDLECSELSVYFVDSLLLYRVYAWDHVVAAWRIINLSAAWVWWSGPCATMKTLNGYSRPYRYVINENLLRLARLRSWCRIYVCIKMSLQVLIEPLASLALMARLRVVVAILRTAVSSSI